MKTISLAFLFFPLFLHADVSPDYEKIFSVKVTDKLIACQDLAKDNYTCSVPLIGTKKVLPFTTNGGEGDWNVRVTEVKKVEGEFCYLKVETEEKKLSWAKAPCAALTTLDAVLERYLAADPELQQDFKFNPLLDQVFTQQNGTSPLPFKDMYQVKEEPMRFIGTITVPLKAGTSITLSYPTKEESTLTAEEFLKIFPAPLSVLKKDGDKYLVLIPQAPQVAGGRMKGVAASSLLEKDSKAYAWVNTQGGALTFARDYTLSPLHDIKYVMQKGPNYQQNKETWTSIKVHATIPDFERTNKDDFSGINELLPRKKIFLRDVFLPLYNKSGTINFWFHWEPGC